MDMISGLRARAAEKHRDLHPDVASAFSLDGRTAVVTGAATVIGRQASVIYAGAGARVVLADTAKDALEETAALIDDALVIPTEVTQKAEVDELARQAIRATGRIDAWANVAGLTGTARALDAEEEDLDAMLVINLKGAFWGCAAAARVMVAAGRGSIINVASDAGHCAVQPLAIDGLAMASALQLTRTVAAELGPKGVRVNLVAAGPFDTAAAGQNPADPERSVNEIERASVVTAGRFGRLSGGAADSLTVAWSMLFLAADASHLMTGQILKPCGGVFASS